MNPRTSAAKILKRTAQLGRLGPRGLLRTAYVRTMAPTVYRLADAARGSTIGLHRHKLLTRALPARLERLKSRIAEEAAAGAAAGRKLCFPGDSGRFVQALEAVLDLRAAGCAVPAVAAVDWGAQAIILAAVDGAGAWGSRGGGEGSERRDRLEQCLLAIHRAGYVLGAIDRDSIEFDRAGVPVVTGLRDAAPLSGLSRDMSVLVRDLDRSQLNRHFGTGLVTARALRANSSPTAPVHGPRSGPRADLYAPVILRDDISWGKIWNTDVGIGRWNFIMRDHLPIPHGGSILDLGSNNGFNPLQMLRAGASSAIGVEIDEGAIAQGMFLKSAFEWLDNRRYDFRYIHGSQADLGEWSLPRFDIVTALCSIYYLPEPGMRDLVGHIRTLSDVLVLQCNTDRLIDRSDPDTYRKASVAFAIDLLESAGFASREVIAPSGYSRPLVIGRTKGA